MEELQQVEYGNSIINFGLTFSRRKTLAIHVYPDSSVRVVAPLNSTLPKIIKKVETKGKWIQKQIRKFTDLKRTSRVPEYVGGETHYYLGRQYRLKVQTGNPDIKLVGKFFHVNIKHKGDKQKVKSLLDSWYKDHAQERLHERFERYTYIIQREKIKFNSIIIMKMAKRWGSCTSKGNIILNTNLVKVPVDCIDYVIIHEICHLKHLNHSTKFYNTLRKYMPDWENKKKKLEEY